MRLTVFIFSLIWLASPAAAQMSISTIGATEAAACFQNANNDFETDTGPCNGALKNRNTTRRDRMKTYINRGIIHNRNSNLTAAIEDFNSALEIDDEQPEAYLNRGNSWFMSSQYDSAFADYERSLEYGVSKPWAAWYNIGLVHDARKETEKARAAYENAVALNPNFVLARKKLETKG